MIRVRPHRRHLRGGTTDVREHTRNIEAPPSLSAQEAESYFLDIVRKLHYEGKLAQYGGTRIISLKNSVGGRIHWPEGHSKKFYLEINQNGWNLLNIEQQKGLIRHEAIHLYHPRHDSMFNLVAKSINAPRTVNEMLGKSYVIYGVKPNKEKEKIGEFADYEEAKAFVRIFKYNREKMQNYRGLLITNG